VSRLDELRKDIEALEAHSKRERENIACREERIAAIKEQISRLEAESARPREFIIGVDKNGYPVSVGKYGTGILHHVSSGALLPEMYIGAIEKLPVKPLVITREMAQLLEEAGYREHLPHSSQERWANILKAAGIDSIPEGGK